MAGVLDYNYGYQFSSTLNTRGLHWAAMRPLQRSFIVESSVDGQFFAGKLSHPQVVCRMLSVLSRVVRTHFFEPMPPNRDPVVTSSPTTLRWEGFSGCCGVYSRIDLDGNAFESCVPGFGTTNVDFNPEMLSHLTRVGPSDSLEFQISVDAVSVRRDDETVTERKVALPHRWIKGFGEVQAYQSRLKAEQEFSARLLSRFLQTLPRQSSGQRYLIVQKTGLRQSTREQPGSILVGGIDRLKVLTPLLPDATNVRVWGDRGSGTTGWQIDLPAGRFWLVLSPELYRGFSGEGQILTSLADGRGKDIVDDVQNLITNQATIDPAEIAAQLGAAVADVQHALMALSVQGLAGFDADSGLYFHRELPFALDTVESSQPRLKGARKLVATGDVKVVATHDDHTQDVEVHSYGTLYFVKLRPAGDRCNCPWFGRYQGERGPCKHVLAARIFVDEQKGQD